MRTQQLPFLIAPLSLWLLTALTSPAWGEAGDLPMPNPIAPESHETEPSPHNPRPFEGVGDLSYELMAHIEQAKLESQTPAAFYEKLGAILNSPEEVSLLRMFFEQQGPFIEDFDAFLRFFGPSYYGQIAKKINELDPTSDLVDLFQPDSPRHLAVRRSLIGDTQKNQSSIAENLQFSKQRQLDELARDANRFPGVCEPLIDREVGVVIARENPRDPDCQREEAQRRAEKAAEKAGQGGGGSGGGSGGGGGASSGSDPSQFSKAADELRERTEAMMPSNQASMELMQKVLSSSQDDNIQALSNLNFTPPKIGEVPSYDTSALMKMRDYTASARPSSPQAVYQPQGVASTMGRTNSGGLGSALQSFKPDRKGPLGLPGRLRRR